MQTYGPTIRYHCPLDCGWHHDAPPSAPGDVEGQFTQAPNETFPDMVTRVAGETARQHLQAVDAVLLGHLETHTIPQFVAKLAGQRDAIQRVRDLHEQRDSETGAPYCDACSNHGDITWPCATIRALDGEK
ncbi:hypothetical protein [Streptomyces sp. NBC_01422]|uniref:hypothetical protein n=1 Tax=Streptomyces sp. NBC_01422 TaxID=2903859 RepID=UPI002E2E8269|nr:hypothetical protein [Streptomyces sp. NBC_01422]